MRVCFVAAATTYLPVRPGTALQLGVQAVMPALRALCQHPRLATHSTSMCRNQLTIRIPRLHLLRNRRPSVLIALDELEQPLVFVLRPGALHFSVSIV
jgi:hypothetical protein